MSRSEFVRLITQNQAIIHKVCHLYCDTQSEREDAFQEIVLQLWKAYPTFQRRSRITTWIHRVALNTAISLLRKAKHRRYKAIEEIRASDPKDAHTSNFDSADVGRLYQAIGRLNQIEKAVILLHLEELSYREIADILGITQKNVSVKLVRIKSKLEKILTAEEKQTRS